MCLSPPTIPALARRLNDGADASRGAGHRVITPGQQGRWYDQRVVCTQWRWTARGITRGHRLTASLRKAWLLSGIAVCPPVTARRPSSAAQHVAVTRATCASTSQASRSAFVWSPGTAGASLRGSKRPWTEASTPGRCARPRACDMSALPPCVVTPSLGGVCRQACDALGTAFSSPVASLTWGF